MKVLLINGSPHKDGHCYTAADATRKLLGEQGIETEIFWITNNDAHGCLGCYRCLENDRCVQDDDICNILADKMQEADGILVVTPVYFGGPNSKLAMLFDRIFYSRCVKNQLFAGKPGGVISVCDTMGGETSMQGITRYFATSQMPVISCMGFPTLTMKMIEEDNQRYHTVISAMADNMARRLGICG